jgi:hypothetical protein
MQFQGPRPAIIETIRMRWLDILPAEKKWPWNTFINPVEQGVGV